MVDEDREFLLEVYAAGREIELSAVPWDAAMKHAFVEHQYSAQAAHYEQEYPGAKHEIIVSDGEDAGRIYLDRGTDEIAILDMAVLPGFQRRGIASELVRRLQKESGLTGRSIRVFVESFNPANQFFTGLGFIETSNDGMSRRFDWKPVESDLSPGAN